MTILSSLRHKKQFTNYFDEIDLFVDGLQFYVRVKYASTKTSNIYKYSSSTEARLKYTQLCLFILS